MKLPVLFDCPACGGRGCEACHEKGPNAGRFVLNRCPLEYVTADIWDALRFADLLLDAHLPPVSGGAHDQAECFMDAVRFYEAERRHYRREDELKKLHET